MNTRIEATLMISAGAMLAAAAQFGPSLVERGVNAITRPAPILAATPMTAGTAGSGMTWETSPIVIGEHQELPGLFGARVLLCQDDSITGHSANNANISTHDDRGDFTVSIVDGELRKVEVQGEYTLDEGDDTVRILDPDGNVALETSKSNPTINDLSVLRQQIGGPFWNRVSPGAQADRAALGIGTTSVEPAMAAQLGIDDGEVVEFITPGSGADAGDLRLYDVIVAIDDQPVGALSLSRAIASHKPGETVRVTLIRNGSQQTIPVELGSAPGVAPAFNGFGFAPGDMTDFQEMRRMLQVQVRQIKSQIDSMTPRTPHQPLRYQRMSPAPTLRPAPAPAPAPANDPNTTDASDMAPKIESRSTPA